MKEFKENFGRIAKEQKALFAAMIVLAVLALVLLIFSLVSLQPGSSVVKVGYGDIGRYQGGEWSSMSNSGGYHDGSWMEMLAFPLLALIFGVLHNFINVKLYEKRGAGYAMLFCLVSILLVLGAFLVLIRLLGEG